MSSSQLTTGSPIGGLTDVVRLAYEENGVVARSLEMCLCSSLYSYSSTLSLPLSDLFSSFFVLFFAEKKIKVFGFCDTENYFIEIKFSV